MRSAIRFSPGHSHLTPTPHRKEGKMQALSARTAIAAPAAKLNARAPARKVRPVFDPYPRFEGPDLNPQPEMTVLTWR